MNSSEYHSSIVLSSGSGGGLRSIVVERNSFSTCDGGYMDPNELHAFHHPLHAAAAMGTSGRSVPTNRLHAIYTDTEAESLVQGRISRLELEKAKLHQLNKLKANECEDWRQKCETLQQQLNALTQNNAGGGVINYAGPSADARMNSVERHLAAMSSNVDARLGIMERKLNELMNTFKGQMNVLISAVSNVDVKCEAVNIRLDRIEESFAKEWVDVHEYQQDGNVRSQSMMDTSFERRGFVADNSDISMFNNSHDDDLLGGTGSGNQNGGNRQMANGELHPHPGNHEGIVDGPSTLSPTYLERRQSDSTTITTLESGYGDDRDVFETGYDDAGGAENHQMTDQTDERMGRRDDQMIMHDDDIEFVAEVITPRQRRNSSEILNGAQSSSVQDNPHNNESQQSRSQLNTSAPERHNRPSIFSRGVGPAPRTSVLFDSDLEDECDNPNQQPSQNNVSANKPRQSLDPEISNLNDIFEINASQNTSSGDSSDVFSTTPTRASRRKRGSSSSQNESKRIRGILKAPIKREPGTISIYSSRGTSGASSAPVSPVKTSPVKESQPSSGMIDLRNIKKERVAHAIDGYNYEENAWKCICGHQTNTKNGMKLHVKNMGTEEARYMCPWQNCDRRFLFPFLVRNHLLKDHKDSSVPDKLYGCEKCYRIFYEKNAATTHRNARNEVCKSTPRRRSYPIRTASLTNTDSGSGTLNQMQGRVPIPITSSQSMTQETSKQPSIIITL